MRLIDANALYSKIKEYFNRYLADGVVSEEDWRMLRHSNNISQIIREEPTVERPRGEWIKTFRCKGENINTGAISSLYYYDCSKCKYRTGNQGKKFYFCPNCGADMRGGE